MHDYQFVKNQKPKKNPTTLLLYISGLLLVGGCHISSGIVDRLYHANVAPDHRPYLQSRLNRLSATCHQMSPEIPISQNISSHHGSCKKKNTTYTTTTNKNMFNM